MTPPTFRLLPEAEEDANHAFDWYQAERFGSGNEFRIQVKLAFERIKSHPEQFPVVHGSQIRRARLQRLPYSVFFRSVNNSILVLAVFHEK
jgi:toxin ParE1/3/4